MLFGRPLSPKILDTVQSISLVRFPQHLTWPCLHSIDIETLELNSVLSGTMRTSTPDEKVFAFNPFLAWSFILKPHGLDWLGFLFWTRNVKRKPSLKLQQPTTRTRYYKAAAVTIEQWSIVHQHRRFQWKKSWDENPESKEMLKQ